MSIREARCPNCGSLIDVDDRKPEAVCMFCWHKFSSQKGIDLAEDASGHVFANEAQEEPSAEDQAAAFGQTRVVEFGGQMTSKPSPKKAKPKQPGQLTAAEKVKLSKKEIVRPRVSKQHGLMILGAIVGVVAIMTAIFLPLTLRREQQRAKLNARIQQIVQQPIEEKAYHFSSMQNKWLLLTLPREVKEQEANALFERFRQERADVYGQEIEQQKGLRLDLAGENGIYTVNDRGVRFLANPVALSEPSKQASAGESTPSSQEAKSSNSSSSLAPSTKP